MGNDIRDAVVIKGVPQREKNPAVQLAESFLANAPEGFYKFELRAVGTPAIQNDTELFAMRDDVSRGDGGGRDGSDGSSPSGLLDDELTEDHPFAISVKIVGTGGDGSWSKARVSVVGGSYGTNTATDFSADAIVDEEFDRGDALFGVYLWVPVEPAEKDDVGAVLCSDGQYAKAVDDGVIFFSNSVLEGYPQRLFNVPLGGPGFAVFIGSWNVRRLNTSGGVATYVNRVVINQVVSANVLVGETGTDSKAIGQFQFVFVDGTTQQVSLAAALDDFDPDTDTNWSIKLPVNGTTFKFTKGTLTFDDETDFYDSDPQTFYVVPVIRDGVVFSTGGVFRETIVCVSGKPIVQLVKIS
jgi:hypothetical protein